MCLLFESSSRTGEIDSEKLLVSGSFKPIPGLVGQSVHSGISEVAFAKMNPTMKSSILLFHLVIIYSFSSVTPQAWTLTNLMMSGTKGTFQNSIYLDAAALGAQKGLEECKKQFQWSPWNCPQTDIFTQIFSRDNPLPPTRETAFVHAIISAGIVHTVTKNCSRGQFEDCKCDRRRNQKHHSPPKPTKGEEGKGGGETTTFRWGGCGDDVDFGIKLAKSYLDERELGHDPTALIKLHNNNVGRMVSVIH